MRHFDLQGVEVETSLDRAFAYIADPANLPAWTNAFSEVAGRSAVMETPEGRVTVGLEVRASAREGTVDWIMTFPDGETATAFSRLFALDDRRCAYAFVLTPPPVPLEAVEGALEAQSAILREELERLRAILKDA